MKSSFAIAAIAGVAMAAPRSSHHRSEPDGRRGHDKHFLNFQAKYNKHESTEIGFSARQDRFQKKSQVLNEINREADENPDPTAVHVEMNFLGDMTQDEISAMLGFIEYDPTQATSLPRKGKGKGNGKKGRGKKGRGLEDVAETVDWAASGHMGPVKSQGSCGSCVQFAVSSAAEASYKIDVGSDFTPHFSEQHLLDCTYGVTNGKEEQNARNQELFGKLYNGSGCGGSWMKKSYDFMKDHGVIPVDKGDYKGQEQLCTHDDADVMAKATNYYKVQAADGIDGMKAAVQERPQTVAINASSERFQYYKSGVIKASDCDNGLNHAVVIVGYQDGGDTPPNPPTPPPPPPAIECKVTKWWHTCPQPETRRLQSGDEGATNYWKVQNSWSTGYGDNGFVLFDIQDGEGVCGINKHVESVEMMLVA